MTLHKRPSLTAQRTCRGLTLIELLVVITISVILLAASVQLLRLPLQSRKTREAARQMSALVSRCKARAAELNRPVGLLFRRDLTVVAGSQFSTQVDVVETPAYYMGDEPYKLLDGTIGSGAWIQSAAANVPAGEIVGSARLQASLTLQPFIDGTTSPPTPRIPLRIRFDHKNPWYDVIRMESVAGNIIRIDFRHVGNPQRGIPVSPTVERWVPFQIEFQPGSRSVFPALNAPTQLPGNVCVDLTASGIGLTGTQFTPLGDGDDSPVVIMFSPDGSVDRIFHHDVGLVPQATVFMLIGRTDQVSPLDLLAFADRSRSNLMDADSIWVAIGHNTGKITVAENLSLIDEFGGVPSAGDLGLALAESRTFARRSQDMGGR